MTRIGAGGVVIVCYETTKRFDKDYSKLEEAMKALVKAKLKDMLSSPMPPGLRFEKLKGHSNPSLYTIHITGNYKLSFSLTGNKAILRRVDCHDEIDRNP